jgi:hypothetical protein
LNLLVYFLLGVAKKLVAWGRMPNCARRIVLAPVTPGVVYTVHFRAVGGSTKYSEWSDPVSHIAT